MCPSANGQTSAAVRQAATEQERQAKVTGELWEAFRLLERNEYSVPTQHLRQIRATAELVKILAQQVDNDQRRGD